MKNETKNCLNCKKDFELNSNELGFYQKINVPPPTLCSKCRKQRRLTWRTEFVFYNRSCDMCKRQIISMYSPDSSITIYCNKCWWSDEWDPKSYGKDIDFSRPFFEQFQELRKMVPALALVNDNNVSSVNCEYTQNFVLSKNCYMCIVVMVQRRDRA